MDREKHRQELDRIFPGFAYHSKEDLNAASKADNKLDGDRHRFHITSSLFKGLLTREEKLRALHEHYFAELTPENAVKIGHLPLFGPSKDIDRDLTEWRIACEYVEETYIGIRRLFPREIVLNGEPFPLLERMKRMRKVFETWHPVDLIELAESYDGSLESRRIRFFSHQKLALALWEYRRVRLGLGYQQLKKKLEIVKILLTQAPLDDPAKSLFVPGSFRNMLIRAELDPAKGYLCKNATLIPADYIPQDTDTIRYRPLPVYDFRLASGEIIQVGFEDRVKQNVAVKAAIKGLEPWEILDWNGIRFTLLFKYLREFVSRLRLFLASCCGQVVEQKSNVDKPGQTKDPENKQSSTVNVSQTYTVRSDEFPMEIDIGDFENIINSTYNKDHLDGIVPRRGAKHDDYKKRRAEKIVRDLYPWPLCHIPWDDPDLWEQVFAYNP